MKRVLLFITLLLFVFKTGHGQTNVYHPFPDSNAVWNETSWFVNNVTLTYFVTPTVYFLAGDTVISSLHYKKILSSGYTQSSNYPFPTSGYFNNLYSGAIRQDSIYKKVYYRTNSSTSVDTLLYNFNLSVGDTLPASYINYHGVNYVSSIDSILIGTNYRKQYHISAFGGGMPGTNYDSLIEGIGSTMGLLYPILIPDEAGSNLNCFSQNNAVMYVNPSGTCDSTLSIKAINKQSIIFNISPNPSSGNISIAGNITIDELKVTDMLGQIVYEAKPNATNTILTLPDAGVYFITLTSDTATSTKKVIVSK
jgi:type IX secretion system substrate protein